MTLTRVPRLRGGIQVHSTPKRIRVLADVKNWLALYRVAKRDGYGDPLQWFLAYLRSNLGKGVEP